MVSRYWWQGAIDEAGETLLILKTRADLVDAVIEALDELHPYDTPELLELPVARAAPRYAAWISEECGPRDEP